MSPLGPGERADYRAPQQCPVCTEELHVTQLGCDTCGTGISGHFQHCSFCALAESELDVLRVFLTARGNMKELERHLGVSYPTARARFDDLLTKLGLRGGPEVRPARDEGAASEPDRLATLRAVATGEMDVQTARQQLGN